MSDERQNTVTIGGVLLQRKSGGATITAPVCQYANVTDEQVQEFWHWWASNPKVQQAAAAFAEAVSGELIAWGDSRNLQVKKEK